MLINNSTLLTTRHVFVEILAAEWIKVHNVLTKVIATQLVKIRCSIRNCCDRNWGSGEDTVANPPFLSVGVESPLLRSGMALAGFNTHSSGTEDGVFTALEASQLVV